MNNRFVLESFSEYLRYQNGLQINEAKEPEEVTLDKEGIKEFVKKIMEYNYLLSKSALDKNIKDSGESSSTEFKSALNLYANPNSESYSPAKMALVEVAQAVLKSYKPNPKDLKDTEDLLEMGKALKIFKESQSFEDPTRSGKPLSMTQRRTTLSKYPGGVLDKMSSDEARKLFDDFLSKYSGKVGKYIFEQGPNAGYRNIATWGLATEQEKEKVYNDILSMALKKGYKNKEQLLTIAEKSYNARKGESNSMVNPGIKGYLSTEKIGEITKTLPTGEKQKTFLLDKDESAGLFKPNMFGANGESDYMEASFKKIVENLSTLFARSMTGEIQINKINISTSADRYRNTESAESISWGELSYARAVSMASLIGSVAEGVGLPPEVVKNFPKIISLYYRGTNGDGTSGPNPPEGIYFGYYVKSGNKSKWVNTTENRSEKIILEIGDQGQPIEDNADNAKKVSEAPKAGKKDYNEFRYNLIEVEYTKFTTKPGEKQVSEEVFDFKYPLKVTLPARYSTKTFDIKIPVITLNPESVGLKSTPGECPVFGETTKLKIGFGIKKVNIARWSEDLAKP